MDASIAQNANTRTPIDLKDSDSAWLHVDQLRVWDKNPRKADAAVPRVQASLRRFGFVAPIVVWRSADRMVAGHTRLRAMRALLAEEPGFVAKGAPGAGLCRVVFHEFASEAEANAYALADNRLNELAEWDEEGVREIVRALEAEDASLVVDAGWSPEEMRALLGEDAPPPDSVPEPLAEPAVPVVLGAWQIVEGDALASLQAMPANHFDALLSDPPYGLSFMGKAWDYDVPTVAFWREVLRVLKPGAPIIAFSGTRTYHRMVVAIEDAGFEIRDQIGWCYGSGFPKSLDVSKAIDAAAGADREVTGTAPALWESWESNAGVDGARPRSGLRRDKPATPEAERWDGYGTALKPAWEPAVLARKPLDGTVAENAMKWGVGGLAIDAARIPYASADDLAVAAAGAAYERLSRHHEGPVSFGTTGDGAEASLQPHLDRQHMGRWPANLTFDPSSARVLDVQVEAASRFFYIAKPSRGERELGLAGAPRRSRAEVTGREEGSAGSQHARAGAGSNGGNANFHPTVKPAALARHLATLLLPPHREGDARKLLVPFSGSGSEVIGGLLAGWDDVTGLEREPDYIAIAKARITHAVAHPDEWVTPAEDDEPESDEPAPDTSDDA